MIASSCWVQSFLMTSSGNKILLKLSGKLMQEWPFYENLLNLGAPVDDLKSLLEQSATVWHSRLTEENASDLERVQKSAMKVIFKKNLMDIKIA